VVDLDRVAGDHTKPLEPIDAALDRWGGQADATPDVGQGAPRVALQEFEDLVVGAVELGRRCHARNLQIGARNERLQAPIAAQIASVVRFAVIVAHALLPRGSVPSA
jgi:hypothetical protein